MGNEWKEYKLGELFSVKHGFAFKGKYFSEERTTFLLTTPGNFAVGGGFQFGKEKYYSGPIPDDYVLHPGQVIVNMTDLSKESDTLGYSAIVPNDDKTWLHNQRIGLLEFKNKALAYPKFIYFLLHSKKYRHWIVASASGTTVKHTSPKRIEAYECRIPPIAEQRRIAHILGTLDDKITLNRQQNATLEAMAQALFRSWFVDFDPVLDKALAAGHDIPAPLQAKAQRRLALGDQRKPLPPDIAGLFPDRFVYEEEVGWVPEGWEVKSLKDIAEFSNGKTSPERFEEGIPVFGSNGIIGFTNEFNREDTIIIGRVGSYCGSLYYFPEKCWVTDNAMTGITKNKTFNIFLFEFLKEANLNSRKTGSGQPLLNQSILKSIDLSYPNERIISKFCDFGSKIYETIYKNTKEIKTLSELRDTLLPKLISGELRVPEAEQLISSP